LEIDGEILIVHRIEMKKIDNIEKSKMKPYTKENWHMLN
jgi:hypothetical protein